MLLSLSGNDVVDHTVRFAIGESSQIGEARRHVARLAEDLELDEARRGRVGIVINEMGTNLLKHARTGEILVRALKPARAGFGGSESSAVNGIELISIDRGPGIDNLAKCMTDGYSTGSSSGTGLGAIRRLSDVFDIFSSAKGTCICSITLADADARGLANTTLQLGAVVVPVANETLSGDSFCLVPFDGGFSLLVVDGLGHGPLAHEAALTANEAFRERADGKLATGDLLTVLHNRLRSTRGAAIFILKMSSGGQIEFSSAGNIGASIQRLNSESRTLISQNGTAGVQIRRPVIMTERVAPGDLLILASDGLGTRYDLNQYPGLRHRHPSVVAAVLYRDFARGNDDVAVVVGRIR